MCSFTFLSARFITYTPSFILGKLFLEKTPLNLGSWLKQLVVSICLKDGVELKVFIHVSSSCSSNSSSAYAFTTEEVTGCTIDAAKGANEAPRIRLLVFFVFFHVLLFQ